jgi:tryptophan synthase alpha chain
MSRIESRFNALARAGRKALIPYVMAGDPSPGETVPLMQALVEAGADLIELGVPFSDPMADGPVIQAAGERALAHGVALHHVLEMVNRFRRQDPDTPVLLMGYLNPIEAMGYDAFADAAAAAGVDGVLTVDLPPEESAELLSALDRTGLDPIFLTAPTTREDRLERIARAARGFIYYVSLKGVTGSDALDTASVSEKLAKLRAFTPLPLGVGFGISTPEAAARVGALADGVVVGSALVRRVGEFGHDPVRMRSEVCALVSGMRSALDAKP